ncbi:MAG: hypothetical protein ACI8XB_000413 [Patiriisocius sp.]|jgi:hypothetical protein
MKKCVILILAIFLGNTVTFGQIKYGSSSGKMKAKEAKKEAKAAKNDTAYQSLMDEGHELFSDNQFEEAIEKYETASNKRPINVYPRVKIADVQLAMLNYVEEVEEPEITESEVPEITESEVPETPELKPEEDTTQADRVAAAYREEEKKIIDSLPPAPKFDEPQVAEVGLAVGNIPAVVVKEEEVPKMTVEEFSEELADSYPDGITEEILNENGKKITRRVVVKNGKGSDYRKVEHRWGGVFYFKNDEAIAAHTWNMETVLD